MADEDRAEFAVKLWLNTSEGKFNLHEEHWFRERPETEILVMLLGEARRTLTALFPGEETATESVHIVRLRPADTGLFKDSGLFEND